MELTEEEIKEIQRLERELDRYDREREKRELNSHP